MSQAGSAASDLIVVGNSSDDPFAIDVAYAMGQSEDIADLISMKSFANSEFCPRFISDEQDFANIGNKLQGKNVVIVSTSNLLMSRQSLAMRNLLIARAAKENGAAEVVLVEPDLYYSAQDRGPRNDLGTTDAERSEEDRKKFDGQPFTAKLYAQMLRLAGVDHVVTVHNHSSAVQSMFSEVFEGGFHNLIPYEIYIDYLLNSNIVNYGKDGAGLALCAPDEGARDFVLEMFAGMGLSNARFVLLDKERTGERDVAITLHAESESTFEQLDGHDIVLFDDMVRTGSTVVQSCQFLKQINPGKTVFAVSHFYASDEGREKMASPSIDEIVTLNTIPTILNRDVQGRLRRKMVVLKIEKWLARNLCEILKLPEPQSNSLYQIDMSSKNERFQRKIWLSEELKELPNSK
ncbi:MAG: ribose-phosphate pyrophosphokinase [Gemmatimonadetes bacterium]|nr:ribose-phosphate pyrophosphokinase [Gemmatimonadota bacterium]MBT4609672.1 ribose-phosphate pyrophosphokinase [Gemmatimonadota bacterium]MBT5145594.1 ribose-phosphate pyrophosphokinase [Gemmatimonadota bacterium]MBT5587145.1 ribose-phosphate pyrophosphokinase [Gemmatimonadota bacterium]MBT5963610.1 ribose-phosphate pyrophosphokinase [Gemmatimonadota bacterium]